MSTQAKRQSAMFRSIVMMGGGLAFSCGGVAQQDPRSNPSSGGSGSAGKPSTATAGNSNLGAGGSGSVSGSGSAGAPIIGSGGGMMIGVGGATMVGVAGAIGISGASGAAGSGGAPALDCPPSQWTCTGPESCSYETGWSPLNCKCDPSRPKSPGSCGAGQTFTCLGAGANGMQYGFECACVPNSGGCTCSAAFGSRQGGPLQCDEDTSTKTTLCGCAVILLK